MKKGVYTIKDQHGTVIAQDLDVDEVSKLLGISQHSVYSYARDNLLYKKAYAIIKDAPPETPKVKRIAFGKSNFCQEWDDICAILRPYKLSHIVISCKK